MQSTLNISALQAFWQAFDNMAHLRLTHTEADYDHTVKLMNALLPTLDYAS